MIQISKTYGIKSIFLNVNKNTQSNSISTIQYTPDSFRSVLRTARVKLFITNKLSGKIFSTLLTYKSSNTRGLYFTFTLGDGTNNTWLIDEDGTFDFEVFSVSDSSPYSEKVELLDSGLFRIYNNDTFTDEYFDEEEQTIPTTIVYKP